MKPSNSFFARLIDLIAPRACPACGNRLSITERMLCANCNLALPRRNYYLSPYDNELARLFWGRIPIEKCVAFCLYQPQALFSHLIYKLKYYDHPEIGTELGRMIAEEYLPTGFFEGIDLLLPVPLARKRIRLRGYNQSVEIARGIKSATHLPIVENAVRRKSFKGSQTKRNRWERNMNVENDFELLRAKTLENKHVLLIDDVITTGATITALGKEVMKAQNVKISILALGFTKS
ncbi:ComF family protein [Prevotella brunnea]|uniref:ComF family protein n=2 Tax=Prevotellaceae TaxID=171552 RepID=A0A5C8GG63_9BACT|nr:ComF family protein [Prevotella brunnea]